MKLEKRTIEEWVYTDSNGNQTLLKDLNPNHLLAAYSKSLFDEAIKSRISGELRNEILRRMGSKPWNEPQEESE